MLSLPTVLPTPDNEDSTQNGTRISPCQAVGIACSDFGSMAYCHKPLRFFQSFRTICGLGYSASTFAGSTFSAQGDLILSPADFQPWLYAIDCESDSNTR